MKKLQTIALTLAVLFITHMPVSAAWHFCYYQSAADNEGLFSRIFESDSSNATLRKQFARFVREKGHRPDDELDGCFTGTHEGVQEVKRYFEELHKLLKKRDGSRRVIFDWPPKDNN